MQSVGFPILETKAFEQDGAGVVEAIVSVFDVVDTYGERVVPGAFAESLRRRLPVVTFAHRLDMPIGRTLEAAELAPGDPRLPEAVRDKGGLYVKAKLNLETQRGREAYSDLKNGILDEFSIGYRVLEAQRGDDGVTELTKIDLVEWSPVVSGANPETTVVSVKSGDSEASSSPSSAERGNGETSGGLEVILKRALAEGLEQGDYLATLSEIRRATRTLRAFEVALEEITGVADLRREVSR